MYNQPTAVDGPASRTKFVFGIVFLGASRWPPQIVIRYLTLGSPVPLIDRTRFENDPKTGGFTGAVHLGSRLAEVHVRSAVETERAWNHAELILAYLQAEMNCVEDAVRDLLLRLDGFSEDTPKSRRKIERLLSQMNESDVTCVIHDETASVYFDQPRLTDHIIELQFRSGAKLVSATIAG